MLRENRDGLYLVHHPPCLRLPFQTSSLRAVCLKTTGDNNYCDAGDGFGTGRRSTERMRECSSRDTTPP